MKHTTIIAEIGVNHNGDIELAKKMIDAAGECGVDYVKFQTVVPEKLIAKSAPKADYQKKTTDSDESQLEMIRKITLPLEAFGQLQQYCQERNLKFISTPFDEDSINYLDEIGMPLWKVPSGEVTNLPYLIQIAKTGKPVIMSTGMCTMEDIHAAIDVLRANGTKDITVLHCTTEYPAPIDEVNLHAMETMKKEFQVDVGYSDHTEGIEVAIAATALGATVIEKHFTLDRGMEGPDHKASTEPDEFKRMVQSIRNIDKALGSYEKTVSESEMRNMTAARKSIVAAKLIRAGEVFSEDNLTTKRPGDGISPMKWFDVIGQKAKRDFMEDEKVEI